MPAKAARVRRIVVPGLTIIPVKPSEAGKSAHIAIERAGNRLTLNMATVPSFLSICSQMRRALAAPIALRDGAEFSCLAEGRPYTGYIELRQHPGTDQVSIWRGSEEVIILDGWELPALTSVLSALAEELSS